MKRKNLSRAALALVALLALATGMTACSRDYNVAFVYSASTANATISAFAVDYQTGTLNQLDGSPFTTNGRNPVYIVASPDSKFLYVLDRDDSLVQPYSIGSDGKLYAQTGKNTTGSYPVWAAIDPQQKFLYVVFTYQNTYTTASPGPGGVSIFPINGDGTLGTPTTQVVGNNPVSVVTSALNHFVYVLDQETAANGSPIGQLLAFSQNTSTGALTPLSGTTISTVNGRTVATGTTVGNQPSAMAEDQVAEHIYVTDRLANQILGYTVTQTASGVVAGTLTPLPSNPTVTGQYPVAITIDPRGKYLYVANFSGGSLSGYQISQSNGSLTGITGSATTAVQSEPTCISIEPALGKYMYVTNRLSGQLSGLQLKPETGGLTNIELTPFDVGGLPSCVATAANGEHSTQIVNP